MSQQQQRTSQQQTPLERLREINPDLANSLVEMYNEEKQRIQLNDFITERIRELYLLAVTAYHNFAKERGIYDQISLQSFLNRGAQFDFDTAFIPLSPDGVRAQVTTEEQLRVMERAAGLQTNGDDAGQRIIIAARKLVDDLTALSAPRQISDELKRIKDILGGNSNYQPGTTLDRKNHGASYNDNQNPKIRLLSENPITADEAAQAIMSAIDSKIFCPDIVNNPHLRIQNGLATLRDRANLFFSPEPPQLLQWTIQSSSPNFIYICAYPGIERFHSRMENPLLLDRLIIAALMSRNFEFFETRIQGTPRYGVKINFSLNVDCNIYTAELEPTMLRPIAITSHFSLTDGL